MSDTTFDVETLDAPSAMRVPHVERVSAHAGPAHAGAVRHTVRSAAPHPSTLASAKGRAPQVLRSSTMSAHTEPAQLSFEFSRM